MNSFVKSILFLSSLLISVLFAEGVAQIYVKYVAMQGKLFEPDSVTGWRLKADLDLKRKNSNGDIWTIKTDQNGIRGNSNWDPSKRKVLIVGDSYAFGTGVNVEDRFDAVIEKNGFSVINLGVIGYGTDQELLMATSWYETLKRDDIFIILTYYNDFWDICRHSHSGRAKVWYELIDGTLIKHDPIISWGVILRDKSYLWAKISGLFDRESFEKHEIVQASHIYNRLVHDIIQNLNRRGVRVLLVYFGFENIQDTELRHEIENNLMKLCNDIHEKCISLDTEFSGQEGCFLSDGHWNKKGNALVGTTLVSKMQSLR